MGSVSVETLHPLAGTVKEPGLPILFGGMDGALVAAGAAVRAAHP